MNIKTLDTHIVIYSDIASIPIACPVCDTLFRTIDDVIMYKKFCCCEFCAQQWAYKYSDVWMKGWRPTQDEILIALKLRSQISISL